MKLATIILTAIGIGIALIGLGADYLLPGASPGVNLPQALLIAVGLAIAIGAAQTGRGRVPNWFAATTGRLTATVAIITVLTLLALELVLILSGWPTYFPSALPDADVSVSTWWNCEYRVCRYRQEKVLEACADGLIAGRHCQVNHQGFGDSEDFVIGADFAGRTRVMMLGDSFTQGFSAEVGRSFVEVLEAALPETVVWNAAISGTGTSQALAVFHEFAPQLKPDLTILGFYMNDFLDNLVPLNSWLQLYDRQGRVFWLRRFHLDRWGNPVEVPLHISFAYAALDSKPPLNDLERILGSTRLGSLALRFLDWLSGASARNSLDHQLQQTRTYLIQLRDAASALESDFLVLLIPRRDDIGNPSLFYKSAVQLMEDLHIPYMSVISTLDRVEDYAARPDNHWSSSGHQKIGELLSECMADYISSADLAECANVVMP